MKSVSVIALLVVGMVTGVGAQDENYVLSFDAPTEVAQGSSFDVGMILDSSGGDDIQGYQWGVCHDDALLSIGDGDVVNGSALDGVEFTFQAVTVYDDEDPFGWTVGALLSVIAMEVLPPEDGREMFVGTYTAAEVDEDTETTLEYCGDLGSPEVIPAMVVGGGDIEPTQEASTITVLFEVPVVFLRGDADGNGAVNGVLDVMFLLEWAFVEGSDVPGCLLTTDVNDNDVLDPLLDGILLIEFLFTDGPPPPDPTGDTCGPDPTPGSISCETPPDCA